MDGSVYMFILSKQVCYCLYHERLACQKYEKVSIRYWESLTSVINSSLQNLVGLYIPTARRFWL
jgi:hypothetical protein